MAPFWAANRPILAQRDKLIQGFETMLWLRKGLRFSGPWTVREQNQLLASCCGLPIANKRESGTAEPFLWPAFNFATSSDRRHVWAYATLHVWDRSPGLGSVKMIADAIRRAVHDDLELNSSRLLDVFWSGVRFVRDPDGQTAHAIVTIEALIDHD